MPSSNRITRIREDARDRARARALVRVKFLIRRHVMWAFARSSSDGSQSHAFAVCVPRDKTRTSRRRRETRSRTIFISPAKPFNHLNQPPNRTASRRAKTHRSALIKFEPLGGDRSAQSAVESHSRGAQPSVPAKGGKVTSLMSPQSDCRLLVHLPARNRGGEPHLKQSNGHDCKHFSSRPADSLALTFCELL